MNLIIPSILIGLSYILSESLYLKTLDFIFGSGGLFYIFTIALFILGGAIGNSLSLKIKRPFLIEIFLSIFNISLVLSLEYFPQILSTIHLTEFIKYVLAFFIVMIPAVCLGISFPIFSNLHKHPKKIYFYQSLGGLFGLFLGELVLFPLLGIKTSLIILSIIHMITSIIIRNINSPIENIKNIKLNPKIITLGIITGAIQSLFIIWNTLLFQPFFYTNFFILFNIFLGLAIGSLYSSEKKTTIKSIFSYLILFFMISIFLISRSIEKSNIHLWDIQYQFILSLFIFLPVFSIIGTIFSNTLTLKTKSHISSNLMSISIGNLIGLLLLQFINTHLSFQLIVILLGSFIFLISNKKILDIICISLILLFSFKVTEYDFIKIEFQQHQGKIIKFKKHLSELNAIYEKETLPNVFNKFIYQSGFSPINLDAKKEDIITNASASLINEKNNCLVIGVGSGRSAGACGNLFQRTDYVDISRLTNFLIDNLSDYNFNLKNQSFSKYWEMDGLLIPYLLHKKYDLIILTVDPGYHYQSGKLYSIEFFSKLSKMLTNNGVFVFWLDSTIGESSNKLLIKTSKNVFNFQKYYVIEKENSKPSYFLVINKNQIFNKINTIGNINLENYTDTLWFNLNSTKTNSLWNPSLDLLTSSFNKKAYFPKESQNE